MSLRPPETLRILDGLLDSPFPPADEALQYNHRLNALQRSKSSSDFGNYMWTFQSLGEWSSCSASSLLVINGGFPARFEMKRLCVDLVDELQSRNLPVIWALKNADAPSTADQQSLTTADLIKHLIRQILRLPQLQPTQSLVASLAGTFQRPTTNEDECFQCLGAVLACLPEVFVVIDTAVSNSCLGNSDDDTCFLPIHFCNIFRTLDRLQAKSNVKVVLVSYGKHQVLPRSPTLAKWEDRLVVVQAPPYHAAPPVVPHRQQLRSNPNSMRQMERSKLTDALKLSVIQPCDSLSGLPTDPSGLTETQVIKAATEDFEIDRSLEYKQVTPTVPRPQHRSQFQIALICALRVEFDAVEALFDEYYENGFSYGKAPGDPNAYTTGRMSNLHVVLAYMPGMGKANSASLAASFRTSFDGIKLGIVVGICGGVPFGTDDEKEIILGDVVIGTGLVQFDFGRQYSNKMVRKSSLQDSLGRPSREVRAILAKLSGSRGRRVLREKTSLYLAAMCREDGSYSYPGAKYDRLYPSDYRHKHQESSACSICSSCQGLDDEVCNIALGSFCENLLCHDIQLIPRVRLDNDASPDPDQHKPLIHFGLIASGDPVMKSGYHRDQIASSEGIIAFEMEGAGVWDVFPTVVIKSVSDYADSHKDKKWQRYAAATAACCMKAFLSEWR